MGIILKKNAGILMFLHKAFWQKWYKAPQKNMGNFLSVEHDADLMVGYKNVHSCKNNVNTRKFPHTEFVSGTTGWGMSVSSKVMSKSGLKQHVSEHWLGEMVEMTGDVIYAFWSCVTLLADANDLAPEFQITLISLKWLK